MSFIVYNQTWQGKRCEVIPRAKAEVIKAMLHDPNALASASDEQVEYLKHVKEVYLGDKRSTPDTSHLTHTGITQGKNEMLPVNDR